jgi:hypothetical protein
VKFNKESGVHVKKSDLVVCPQPPLSETDERLSTDLRARKVSHVTLALWTSADMSKTDLPPFEVAQPSTPISGWFAISLRSLRMGDVFHETYPQNAFDWLSQYQSRATGRTDHSSLLHPRRAPA